MAALSTLHCISSSDAPQHLGKIQHLSQQFKNEGRIADFVHVLPEDAPNSMMRTFKKKDFIVLLLTTGLEPKRKEVTNLLSQLKDKFPDCTIVEIIIDNISFVNEYLTLPKDLKPIRDTGNMDGAWKDIGENLNEILPRAGKGWKKYLKYAIPISVVLVGFLIWKLWPEKTNFSAGITASKTECEAPCEVNFKTTSKNASSYAWDFGDGGTSSYPSPSYTFKQAGHFKVKLVAEQKGQTKDDTITINVTGPPTPVSSPQAAFSSDKTKCDAPCTVVFTNASANAEKYRWEFDNGDFREEGSPTYTFTNSGTFNVKLIAFGNNLQHEATHEIVVAAPPPVPTPVPVAGFNASPTNCMIPCTVTFSNQSRDGTSFRWDFGDGGSSPDPNPTHKYTTGGQFQVKLVALNNGQQHEATGTVTVKSIVERPAFQVTTTSRDAERVRGDDEIGSDDWTRVELGYSIRIVNGGSKVDLILTWYAQELDDDKSPGDTRFKSSQTFPLFNVASCCPGAIIEDVQGIEKRANNSEDYRGELRGFKRFPATGALQAIQVQVDGPGDNDRQLQALTATLRAFSVKLKASN